MRKLIILSMICTLMGVLVGCTQPAEKKTKEVVATETLEAVTTATLEETEVSEEVTEVSEEVTEVTEEVSEEVTEVSEEVTEAPIEVVSEVLDEEVATETTEVLPTETKVESKLSGYESVTYLYLTTNQDTYTKGDKDIVFRIENRSPYEFTYGADFTLEKEVAGVWTVVEPKEPIGIDTVEYYNGYLGTTEKTINLTAYGDLDNGKYRVVQGFANLTLEDGIVYTSAAEFKVVSE